MKLRNISLIILFITISAFTYDVIEESLKPKENNKPVNFSTIPCKYIFPFEVISSGKDTISRWCTYNINMNNHFHILRIWMFNPKWNEPFIVNSKIITLCSVSMIIVDGHRVMVDTISDESELKKIYKEDCK